MIEKKETYNIENANLDKATRIYNQQFNGVAKLGKEIKISPKSGCTVNKPGFAVTFYVPTVTLVIGIGNDHTADLIMTLEAWQVLNHGAAISIDTDKQFAEKYKVKPFK